MRNFANKTLKNMLDLSLNRRKRVLCCLAAVVISLVLAHIYTVFSVSPSQMRRGIVLVEDEGQLFLCDERGASIAVGLAEKVYTTGFLTNGGGLVETRFRPHFEGKPAFLDDSSAVPVDVHDAIARFEQMSDSAVKSSVAALITALKKRQEDFALLFDEMAYYEKTHTVVDEGYNQVMDLHELMRIQGDSVKKLLDFASSVMSGRPKLEVRHKVTVYYRPTEDDSLLILPAEWVDESHCVLSQHTVPDGAFVFNPTALRWPDDERYVFGYLREPASLMDSSLFIPQIFVGDSLPSYGFPFTVLSGSPVVDGRSRLRAVITPYGSESEGGYEFSPRSWWTAICQWIRSLFVSCCETADGNNYDSFTSVLDMPFRERGFEYVDSLVVKVYEENDSLLRGVIRLSAEPSLSDICMPRFYDGDLDSTLLPSGEGVFVGTEYYEGEWEGGLRHGFGIGLIPGRITNVGMWKKDKFQGERITYNADRVYGIDISRYQHESGRRKFPIHWEALRIVNLGTITRKNVDGRLDYPVSFCYIKATQGIKVKSNYSTDDALQARRAGVRVGHYHFFSPCSGANQARWFIENASMQNGDMPPMLDVEISDSQIRQMGGPSAMLREMAEWIKIVKAHCHTVPVLYINQSFVDKYMADAPAEVLECPVWIARYSQYRPYVRLSFWQLSYDGVVKGITPKVDIDIFNGSKEHFEDFYEQYRIR